MDDIARPGLDIEPLNVLSRISQPPREKALKLFKTDITLLPVAVSPLVDGSHDNPRLLLLSSHLGYAVHECLHVCMCSDMVHHS